MLRLPFPDACLGIMFKNRVGRSKTQLVTENVRNKRKTDGEKNMEPAESKGGAFQAGKRN